MEIGKGKKKKAICYVPIFQSLKKCLVGEIEKLTEHIAYSKMLSFGPLINVEPPPTCAAHCISRCLNAFQVGHHVKQSNDNNNGGDLWYCTASSLPHFLLSLKNLPF
ncbi:hypothetical protein PanWU01x14_049070 [Parasponia andersonii]|uniref:Uncharacterized protein n=1 Tax=Parasponia andersonii TaxID=3476 RepID=A0A2P5DMI4_PARAD|nr:hypothetical protein PanWU01x14_049070 [Parasponia andersonii]